MDHEKYQISIERDGRMVPVGSISGESYRKATFSYIEEYLDDRNAVPVSISLPLQRESFSTEGAQKSAEIVTKSHLSLTGASGKVGLYYDQAGGRWYLPEGTAPSTHIVKQSHVRLEGIVTNEQLSMMTAAKCGIEVPQSFIVDLGSGNDSEVL